jgi:hypothetical protein
MRRPGRQTSLACETKSDGKRIDALDAPLNSTPPRRPRARGRQTKKTRNRPLPLTSVTPFETDF